MYDEDKGHLVTKTYMQRVVAAIPTPNGSSYGLNRTYFTNRWRPTSPA